MPKFCVICGAELVDGKCPNHQEAKMMCLNCHSLVLDNGEGNYYCKNQTVLENAKNKILASVPEGFEVDTIVMKPMLLKNPCKKCPNYQMNTDLVREELIKTAGIDCVESYSTTGN